MGALPRYLIEMAGMLIILVLAYWLSGQPGGLERAIPVLGALAFGAQRLLPHVQTLYQSWVNVKGARKYLDETLDFLDYPVPSDAGDVGSNTLDRRSDQARTEAMRASPDETTGCRPVLELRELHFSYKPELAPVLSGVSLCIQHGDRVGLVGATGSGKSTLIDLLMGLLEPSQGELLVEGQLLTSENRRAWQRRVAHVPQSIYLSDASVAENIAFGLPLARIDMDRVKLAASRAQIAEFIETMPEQYASRVGERGIRLSGGQRQRIGIARALYKGAEVLVLDEATSALDDETEKLVMSAMNALDRNLTIIMIAHRTSTLSACNVIFHVEGGKVRLLGDYAQLSASVAH
jgi:ABC-type multidrug transport system fused ATPase/permease subunit